MLFFELYQKIDFGVLLMNQFSCLGALRMNNCCLLEPWGAALLVRSYQQGAEQNSENKTEKTEPPDESAATKQMEPRWTRTTHRIGPWKRRTRTDSRVLTRHSSTPTVTQGRVASRPSPTRPPRTQANKTAPARLPATPSHRQTKVESCSAPSAN